MILIKTSYVSLTNSSILSYNPLSLTAGWDCTAVYKLIGSEVAGSRGGFAPCCCQSVLPGNHWKHLHSHLYRWSYSHIDVRKQTNGHVTSHLTISPQHVLGRRSAPSNSQQSISLNLTSFTQTWKKVLLVRLSPTNKFTGSAKDSYGSF